MNKKILYLTVALVILLLGASPAIAAPPENPSLGSLRSAITKLQKDVTDLQIATGSIWTAITNLQNKDSDLQNQIDNIDCTCSCEVSLDEFNALKTRVALLEGWGDVDCEASYNTCIAGCNGNSPCEDGCYSDVLSCCDANPGQGFCSDLLQSVQRG